MKCSNGHFYDERQFAECPMCAGTRPAAPTGPLDVQMRPAVTPQSSGGATQPLQRENENRMIPNRLSIPQSGPVTTIVRPNALSNIDPVAGWLVCYEGPEKGLDYRIRFGQNAVGRDDNMDIVLKDNAISRNGHCFLTYDHRHNTFVIHSGISHGTVYKNGHLLTGAEELASFDLLELGNSKFVFIALCGDRFRWDSSSDNA